MAATPRTNTKTEASAKRQSAQKSRAMLKSGATTALANMGVLSATKECSFLTSSCITFFSPPLVLVMINPSGTLARWADSSVRKICSSRNAPKCEKIKERFLPKNARITRQAKRSRVFVSVRLRPKTTRGFSSSRATSE